MRITVTTTDGACVDLRTSREDPDALDEMVSRAKVLLAALPAQPVEVTP